ncbi:unnamed protein product [Clonostachys rosea]|uniref:HCNGP-like protein n=1 Tax=Bionectria ochroleuca TaxID=29856 RepID=A0ABY6UXK1_BIOOC|nr:unnamed protein product [Clonostachys rosea]
MAGLVGYASSDEDEEVEQPQQIKPAVKKPSPEAAAALKPQPPVDGSELQLVQAQPMKRLTSLKAKDEPPEQAQVQKDAPSTEDESKVTIGPVIQNATPLGPSLPQVGDSYPGPENDAPDEAPGSPYSANRAALHDLTLPSIPNMDIPPSPPGSPTETTNKKFEQFIQLKKKGVHFNAKLETSIALKNPSLVDKLMAFVDIDEQSQYETTLPTDLWNPKGFPDWAYRDSLKKSQDKIARERESEKGSGTRTAIDFVPALGSGPGNSSAGLVSRGEKREGGWQ